MPEQDPSSIILQGAEVWNRWREQNLSSLSFARPHWYHSPGPGGIQVKGRNHLNFSGMNLSRIIIHNGFAEGLNLSNSVFEESHFEEGDFSRSNFNGALFRNTKFNKTILTGASFDGATFINCNLNRVNLVGASFCVKEITETVVYGISAWDMQTCESMKQSKLVIEKTYHFYSDLLADGKIPMMVDDIELAQFVHYLSSHKKMRDTLNILNARGVLLLGRFKDGGLDRLYSIRELLQGKGYMPMIFDFVRADSLSLIETIVTMAGLSKFIIADLSGPSVPAELATLLSQIKKPVLAFGKPYALLSDMTDYTSALRTINPDDAHLLPALEAELPEMERLHNDRIASLAKRYSADG
jgi:uncharacterized protein YjbI with pentapeptide repeats